MRAIRIGQWGGSEVLELREDVPVPDPGQHHVLVRVARAGINFADTHTRENTYLARYELPLVPGAEVAGVVERDGHGFHAGQRVAALIGTGGYAEYAAAPAATTFAVPDAVDDATAVGLLLQGLTAWHLFRTSAHLARGETVVVHAAAGGVGSLAVQLGKLLGAGRVIATASTPEKRALALELGADAAVDVTREDLAAGLREANLGEPVDVVLEMAGGRTFDQSLEALAPFGRLVTYGMASGQQGRLEQGALLRSSRAVIGFWLAHCLSRPADLVDTPLQELFSRAADGELRVVTGATYGLSEAGRAHADLQARRTTGKLLLDPSA